MRTHTGVAEKMFASLAAQKINIQNITTSEIKISCLIDRTQGKKALCVVHDAFGLGGKKSAKKKTAKKTTKKTKRKKTK
jgi:aspartate kinase